MRCYGDRVVLAAKEACPTLKLAISFGLLALNVALNIPLFLPGALPYRDSIEAGYVSMARFVAAHPNPWGWNPTQYCGFPSQFTYVPAIPYLAAALNHLTGLEVPHVYRIVTALAACLGPAALFLFVLHFTRSRGWALAAGLAYTFFSPCYYLIETIDKDRGLFFLPWRLQVLTKYGEGPHNAGLMLLPLALGAAWTAACGRKYWQIFAVAVLLAAVALTNWIAALALAFGCSVMILTLAGESTATGFRFARLAAAAALAYGFACFWLTPTFVKTIAFNWPADAFNYHLARQQMLLLSGLAAGLLLLRTSLRRLLPGQLYFRFLTLNLFGFAWVVLWFYSTGINVIPEARRYAPEFEMFLLAWLVECLRLVASHPAPALRFFAVYAAAVLCVAGWGQFRQYLTQGVAARIPGPAGITIEYRLASYLARLNPSGRIFATGGLRFRLNAWFDLQQAGGGFESGLRNRIPLDLAYHIRTGLDSPPDCQGPEAVAELEALGVEYLVVHGPKSREHYRDFLRPEKFQGLLAPVHVEEDDIIYRVPFTSFAHVVRPEELSPRNGSLRATVETYAPAIEDPSRPKAQTRWIGAGRLHLSTPVPEGHVVAVQVSYDPGWRAEQNGEPIALQKDRLGFLLLRARPAAMADIDLHYEGTLEPRIMAAASTLVWAGALLRLVMRRA